MSDWKWQPEVTPEDKVGFIYIIENKSTGQYYIGQKKFWKALRRKPLKGQKRVRLDRVESDWKSYYGSSEALKRDVKKYGKENFERTILRICKSKSEMNYYETKEQFDRKVLHDPKSYNGIINCRIGRNQINFE